ncbi:MAG: hypothetical protein H6684_02885 [Deltaproteobacteria bacterium]|nr:hypothetical protein [Deltaproteobacteria bacterium]
MKFLHVLGALKKLQSYLSQLAQLPLVSSPALDPLFRKVLLVPADQIRVVDQVAHLRLDVFTIHEPTGGGGRLFVVEEVVERAGQGNGLE